MSLITVNLENLLNVKPVFVTLSYARGWLRYRQCHLSVCLSVSHKPAPCEDKW